ncbi:mannosyltransferase family protein [Thermogemmatispora sp.]|uniref:mannosyltransferase family protein n=1 Tax=Thermogemmatispora sp. TaxID=1968838 RepID=UPI0035E450F7
MTFASRHRNQLLIDGRERTTARRQPGSDKGDSPAQATVGAGRGCCRFAGAGWRSWASACKAILPAYLLSHLIFAIITYLAPLFKLPNFSSQTLPLRSLLQSWQHWDAGHYILIATGGYRLWWQTAFFPLFPLMEHLLGSLIGDVHLAGLLIANAAGLVLLTVLYRLLAEDCLPALAERVVFFYVLFPSAFFLAAAYSESLFIALALLSFYQLRHQHWWWAGLYGFLAALTRSAGLLLVIVFAYEYLSQHGWRLRALRLDLLAGALIPLGTALFALYCYQRFADPLAFAHAQAVWHRQLEFPGRSILLTALAFLRRPSLSFDMIHNAYDLACVLLILILVVLCLVGPWKFPRDSRSYAIYALTFFVFSILWPTANSGAPLNAFPRYMLTVVPAFVPLARLAAGEGWLRQHLVERFYPALSVSLLSFALFQFLTGGWMV